MEITAAQAVPSPRSAAQPARAVLAEVHHDLDAVRAEWAALEIASAASPFQRLAWVEAWARHVAPALGAAPCLLLARTAQGAPIALLPLWSRRERGLTVARLAGGKHASYGMGLFTPEGVAAFADAAALRRWLGALRGGANPVDLVLLDNQPALWRGQPNPLLALPADPSPSFGHYALLPASSETFVAERLSRDARHKLRRKQRRLAETGVLAIGPVRTRSEALDVLDRFLVLKAERFREQGVPNPFAEPGVPAFLADAVSSGLEAGHAPVQFHAARLDERVIAVFGGASAAGEFCGMFNAFEPSPDVARHSPGDLLLMQLVQDLCESGTSLFDLGVGEARYKDTWCDRQLPLFDSAVALTPRGHAAAALVRAARRGKRIVKQNPALMRLAMALRKRLARSA